jgi:hypothetical protein
VLRTHGLRSDLRDDFLRGYKTDPIAAAALHQLTTHPTTDSVWREQQGLLFRREGEGEDFRLFVTFGGWHHRGATQPPMRHCHG